MNENKNNSNSMSLSNPQDGFEKGNMFKNLYNEYKDYKPANLTATNEQEKKLLDIMATCFASHELNLYLDVNPNNSNYIKNIGSNISLYDKLWADIK